MHGHLADQQLGRHLPRVLSPGRCSSCGDVPVDGAERPRWRCLGPHGPSGRVMPRGAYVTRLDERPQATSRSVLGVPAKRRTWGVTCDRYSDPGLGRGRSAPVGRTPAVLRLRPALPAVSIMPSRANGEDQCQHPQDHYQCRRARQIEGLPPPCPHEAHGSPPPRPRPPHLAKSIQRQTSQTGRNQQKDTHTLIVPFEHRFRHAGL